MKKNHCNQNLIEAGLIANTHLSSWGECLTQIGIRIQSLLLEIQKLGKILNLWWHTFIPSLSLSWSAMAA